MSQLQEIKDALALMFESRAKAQRLMRERLCEGTEIRFYDPNSGDVRRGFVVKVQDDFTIRVRGARFPPRTYYIDVADVIEEEIECSPTTATKPAKRTSKNTSATTPCEGSPTEANSQPRARRRTKSSVPAVPSEEPPTEGSHD